MGDKDFEVVREFLSSEDTVVVHQTRNYASARASNDRRFDDPGACVDEKWDAWLKKSGIDMVERQVEDIWAQPGVEGYLKLRTEVYEKGGIPPGYVGTLKPSGMVDYCNLTHQIFKKQKVQHARVVSSRKI